MKNDGKLPENSDAPTTRLREDADTTWLLAYDIEGDEGFDVRFTAEDLENFRGQLPRFMMIRGRAGGPAAFRGRREVGPSYGRIPKLQRAWLSPSGLVISTRNACRRQE